MTDHETSLERRAAVHAALGDVTRLCIVDLLRDGDRSVKELGETLAVSSNLLAHHLNVLEHTGVLARRRSEGDKRRTYLSLQALDLSWASNGSAAPVSATHLVFVCSTGTARARLAAAEWAAVSDVPATVASIHLSDENSDAVAGARWGLDPTSDRATILVPGDHRGGLIITVCDRAHEELNGMDWAHWSLPDPVRPGATVDFDDVRSIISARVSSLAARVRPASASSAAALGR